VFHHLDVTGVATVVGVSGATGVATVVATGGGVRSGRCGDK
jgi:hypothetical protein